MKNYLSSPEYDRHVQLMLKQHRALLKDPEADYTDEELDELEATWPKLSSAQQSSLQGLSADLMAIVRGRPLGALLPQHELALHRQALESCRSVGAWHDFLKELRAIAPSLPFDQVCAERARAWEALGTFQIALEFLDYLTTKHPDDSGLGFLALACSYQANRSVGVARALEILKRPHEFNSGTVLQACVIELTRLVDSDPTIPSSHSPAIRRLLDSALELVQRTRAETRALRVAFAGFIALCHQHLDEPTLAVKAIDECLEYCPEDKLLQYFKKSLVVQADKQQSVAADAFQVLQSSTAAQVLHATV